MTHMAGAPTHLEKRARNDREEVAVIARRAFPADVAAVLDDSQTLAAQVQVPQRCALARRVGLNDFAEPHERRGRLSRDVRFTGRGDHPGGSVSPMRQSGGVAELPPFSRLISAS